MAQRQKDEVRRSLLDSARTLFAEHGFAGASMRTIAEASGRSLGNLRNYFATKDELFAAAVADTVEDVRRAMKSWRPSFPGADWELLARADESAVQAVARYVVEHRVTLALLLDGSRGSQLEGWADELFETYASLEQERVRAFVTQHPHRLRRPPSARLVRALCHMYFELAKAFVRQQINEDFFWRTLAEYDAFRLAGFRAFLQEETC